MPSITITVSTEAHSRLASLKRPGQSFSEVILEHVYPPPCETAGELLNDLEANPPQGGDPVALKMIRENRGRGSPRPGRARK